MQNNYRCTTLSDGCLLPKKKIECTAKCSACNFAIFISLFKVSCTNCFEVSVNKEYI